MAPRPQTNGINWQRTHLYFALNAKYKATLCEILFTFPILVAIAVVSSPSLLPLHFLRFLNSPPKAKSCLLTQAFFFNHFAIFYSYLHLTKFITLINPYNTVIFRHCYLTTYYLL